MAKTKRTIYLVQHARSDLSDCRDFSSQTERSSKMVTTPKTPQKPVKKVVTDNIVAPKTKAKKESAKLEWCNSIEGHMAITEKEGLFLGYISNLYIDLTKNKVAAMELRKVMWGDKFVVLVKDISSVGEDTVFINEKKNARKMTNINPLKHRSLHDLRGTRITSLNGKHLGRLQDIDIDTQTFDINFISLGAGKWIPINSAEVTIGVDEILVPVDYELKIIKGESAKDSSKFQYGANLINNFARGLHLNKVKEERPHQQSNIQ